MDRNCQFFNRAECRSCSVLGTGVMTDWTSHPGLQLLASDPCAREAKLLPIFSPRRIFPSRVKAKFSVSGTVKKPIVGIVDASLAAKEILDCPLHLSLLNAIAKTVRGLISECNLVPYDIERRQGELKGLITVCNASENQAILRFVLRSTELITRIRTALPRLKQMHPQLTVITANIQPIPHAILEGPEEHILTDEKCIWESYNGFQVSLGPQSFVQVTHEVAKELYQYVSEVVPEGSRLLDLFCGVGGFSFASIGRCQSSIGVELSENAIECAQRGAKRNECSSAKFLQSDVLQFLQTRNSGEFDAVVVNPPRRGLGKDLCSELIRLRPNSIVYSSCNPGTLLTDLRELCGNFRLQSLAPFDMFPLTEHREVVAELVFATS